jgi:hypothetical protein
MLHFRAWLVTACLVSVVSAKATAFDSVPPFMPDSPADAAIVNRVFANWKARQDRTKSFHVEWNTRVLQKLFRTRPVEELRRAFWIEGDDRFRVEFSRVSGSPINWDHMRAAGCACRGQRTWDGTVNRILEWPHDPAAPPLGVVRQETLRDDRDPEHAALFLAFRPLLPLMGLQGDRFRVVSEHAIVDGVHCVKIENGLPRDRVRNGARNWTTVAEHCWVDPARDDVPILFEKTVGGALMWSVAIQYRPSREVGWVPEHWTCQYQFPMFEAHCTVTKLTVNEPLPPKTFQLEFPPGTLVFDKLSHAQFLVARDGSRSPAPPFDFVRSPTFRRTLSVGEPLAFDAVPFGEAVSFLTQVRKVPIEIDKAAFKAAAIDPNFEVHCDVVGLTGMEILRWLAAQCPKPIVLVERDGKLVFKPATAVKESSPGSDRRPGFKNVP